MSDMAWFPFWVRDFLTSRTVAAMSMEQVGVYVMLLCYEWEDGPLPDNPEVLARLTRADVNIVRTVLEHCFVSVQNGWVNTRLEQVRTEQKAKHQKRVLAGKASGRARRKSKQAKEIEHRSSTHLERLEHTDTDTDKKKEVEESAAGYSPTAAAVGVFLQRVGVKWDLKRPISDWCEEIVTTPKYAGADIPYEIQKAADWHSGKRKKPKPSMAIRNWLERAGRDARGRAKPKQGQKYQRLRV